MEQPRRLPFVRIALLIALAIAAVAAALWLMMPRPAAETPPLAGAPIGGAFSLVDTDGHRVSNDSLKGKYRLMYFGYSFCPDVCPVDVDRMMRGFGKFAAASPKLAARVQPVFVTVDPARDTPEALKAFASNFGPRLLALTGTEAEIETAKRAYRVYAAKAAGADNENYLMDHTAFIYLMDPDGRPIMHFERGDSADVIAGGLEKWVS